MNHLIDLTGHDVMRRGDSEPVRVSMEIYILKTTQKNTNPILSILVYFLPVRTLFT